MAASDLGAFTRWRQTVAKLTLPHWQEFPQFPLYVDQVIEIINGPLRSLGVTPVTKAMINNYVKKGLLMAPVKKKYAQNQLATLIVISLLKGAFALPAIRAGIDQVTLVAYPQAAYDYFVDLMQAQWAKTAAPEPAVVTDPATAELLHLAVTTSVARLQTTALLKQMQATAAPRPL